MTVSPTASPTGIIMQKVRMTNRPKNTASMCSLSQHATLRHPALKVSMSAHKKTPRLVCWFWVLGEGGGHLLSTTEMALQFSHSSPV